ncbi:MAG TPA: helix-turn-helix domain-containing protein [Candidatus Thermoplasmatota archaeon]|nr:helix-turn-helix domain-containing protein [Candidatus Thermoplasmatota archaeon]
MDAAGIVTELEKLGMPSMQAATYVLLQRRGPARAGPVARELGLSRPRTYRLLEDMARKGLVDVSLSRPLQYSARAASEVFATLAADVKNRLEAIERSRGPIEQALEELREAPAPGPVRERLEVVHGRNELFRVAGRMIQDARTRVRTASTVAGAFPRGRESGLNEAAQRVIEDGVAFQVILTEAGADDLPRLQEFARQNPKIEIRIVEDLPPMRLTIRDDEEVLLGAIVDRGHRPQEEMGIRSNAPGLVRSQLALFERLWDEAKPLA